MPRQLIETILLDDKHARFFMNKYLIFPIVYLAWSYASFAFNNRSTHSMFDDTDTREATKMPWVFVRTSFLGHAVAFATAVEQLSVNS